MIKIKKLILKSLLSIAIFASQASFGQQTPDQIKAMYIYNIAYGVDWPKEDTIKTITIGVFSSTKAFHEIALLSKSRTIKGKPVKVIRFKSYTDIVPTQILYITKNENAYVDIIYEKIKDKPVLIFTDRNNRPQYTVINFLPLDKGQKRFDINLKNAEKNGISISKTVLKLGGSEEILRDLYSNTEKELKNEHEKLEIKKKEIKDKEKLLDEQESKISNQRKEITDKQGLILSKDKEVQQKNRRLDSMSFEVLKQREKLRNNMAVLDEQEQKLMIQQEEYNKQKEQMLIADKKLKQKQDSIKSIDKKLGESHATIQTQKGVIYIFIAFSILIVFLVFVVLRGLVKKQRTNRKLNEQNIAINKQKEEIVSQSKQVELINSELEKLSIVASKTDNAVTIMDAQGNFEWVNAGFTRLYGYTLQLLRNELDTNIIKASTNPEIVTVIKEAIELKATRIYESNNTTRSGQSLWVQTTITPIINDEGEVIKLISIDTDISIMKKAEHEIKEQHKMIIEQARELEKQNKELEKLSLVASETDNAILVTDAEGNYTWINDAYTRMFGHTFDELTKNVSKNIIAHQSEPHIKKLIMNCIENKETVDYEFKAKAKGGENIWIRTTLTPILNGNGKIKNLIAIDTDISKLKMAEFEIRQKSEELLAQREELKIQNEQIEFQNRHIRSSIIYAKNIQQAILPLKSDIDKFVDSYIIFRPKDVVSGDFYWHAHLPAKEEFTEKVFFAAVDCTGHGVPGAFMSMIGNRLLNEIVLEQKIISPNEILERLDEKVKNALRQESSNNNDGMDLCLLRLEKIPGEKNILAKFCGAKRPLYLYNSNSKEVIIVPADRRSIGGVRTKRGKIEFTNTDFEINQNDTVWLTTDGIIDQNDERRKRLGTPKFITLLEEIAEIDFFEQKEIIESQLDKYKGNEEQRDDITVLAIKGSEKWF